MTVVRHERARHDSAGHEQARHEQPHRVGPAGQRAARCRRAVARRCGHQHPAGPQHPVRARHRTRDRHHGRRARRLQLQSGATGCTDRRARDQPANRHARADLQRPDRQPAGNGAFDDLPDRTGDLRIRDRRGSCEYLPDRPDPGSEHQCHHRVLGQPGAAGDVAGTPRRRPVPERRDGPVSGRGAGRRRGSSSGD